MAAWSDEACASLEEVRNGVDAALAQFRALELIDRPDGAPAPAPPTGVEEPVGFASAIHTVLDHRVRFHGDDADLLAAIDRSLGSAGPDQRAAPVIAVSISDAADRSLVLRTSIERRYADRQTLLNQLPSFLNELAVATRTCLVLHSGAVRSPRGHVVVLAGRSGAGKSTLTGALVRAGWDYLGDEAIGVRDGSLRAVPYPKPLALSASSRDALGLTASLSPNTSPEELHPGARRVFEDIGPIRHVVLPDYEPGRVEAELHQLPVADSIDALLAQTLNLRRVGERGLQTLCDLVAAAEVRTLRHGGVDQAVAVLDQSLG